MPPRPPRSYRLQELLLKAGHEEAAQVVHEAMVTGLQDAPDRVLPGDLAFVYGRDAEARSEAAATAVERGAVALLAQGPLQAPAGVPCAVVEELATAAQRIAVAFYDDPSTRLTTIGFVGSAGKTTTAWLVRGIFEEVEQVGLYRVCYGDCRLMNRAEHGHDGQHRVRAGGGAAGPGWGGLGAFRGRPHPQARQLHSLPHCSIPRWLPL